MDNTTIENAIAAAKEAIACECNEDRHELIKDRHWAAKDAAAALASLICRELKDYPMIDTFRAAGFNPDNESTFATVDTFKGNRVVITFYLLLSAAGPTIDFEVWSPVGTSKEATTLASAVGEDVYNAALNK